MRAKKSDSNIYEKSRKNFTTAVHAGEAGGANCTWVVVPQDLSGELTGAGGWLLGSGSLLRYVNIFLLCCARGAFELSKTATRNNKKSKGNLSAMEVRTAEDGEYRG